MKMFSRLSLHNLNGEPKIFSENNPPEWLTSWEYESWFVQQVLKLDVGEFADTDFSRITRLEDINDEST